MTSPSIAVETAISKITSCVQEVITPLLNSSDPRLDTYDRLIEVLKDLPEYKQQRRRINELELEVERKTQELLRIKEQLDEMSSEGEEVVLEVQDNLPSDGDNSLTNDSDDEASESSSEPTFPSQPIKTIHLTQQNSLFGSAQEAVTAEEEMENNQASVVADTNHSNTSEETNTLGENEEDDEEEVEEIEIDGKTYFCSSETIYECTELGDVGGECGYFKDGEAILNDDFGQSENEDYV